MGLSIILVECDVTDALGVTTTLRFSDRAMFPMSPADVDRADVAWDERLVEPPSLKRTLFDDLQSLSPGLGVGVMTLANADRGLDAYQAHVWGEVRVWRWIYGAPFGEAKALMRGPAAGTPGYDAQAGRAGRVRLTLYDYRLELERPVQSIAFSGANDDVASIYYEGDAGLKGKLKPLAYGRLDDAQIPAPLVNGYKQAYLIHDGPMQGLAVASPTAKIEVLDRGMNAGIGSAGDDTSLFTDTFFDEVQPGPVVQYTQLRRGLTKFTGALVGSVTFGCRGDATGGVYVETPGPIIARLLGRVGVPPERIGASLTAGGSAAVVGAYVQDSQSLGDLVGWLARSAPMAALPDRQGVWQRVDLAPVEAEPSFIIDGGDVLNLEADDVDAVVAGEFTVGWGRIWTTFRRESVATELLGTAEETRLATEYRYLNDEDAALKARFPAGWRKVRLDTALRLEADAQTLLDTLKALFGLRADGLPRRRWRVTQEMTDAALDVALGATVQLTAPQFGVDDRFLLIGEELLRPRRDQIIWTLWG